jgi:copper transport protein
VFMLSVEDSATGKPITGVDVSLLTTMLDMPMGTDTFQGHAREKGCFGVQIDLSMSGLWQIGIRLRTPDHRLHEVSFKMLTSY